MINSINKTASSANHFIESERQGEIDNINENYSIQLNTSDTPKKTSPQLLPELINII